MFILVIICTELIIKHAKTDRGGNSVHTHSSHSEEDYSVWHGHRPHKEIRCYWMSGSQHQVCFLFFSFWNVINSSSSFIIILSFVHLLVEPVFQENPDSYYANVFVNMFLYLNLHQCFSFCNLIISRYLVSFEVMTVYRQLLYVYLDLIWQALQSAVASTHCSQLLADYHSGVCTAGWH